MSSLKALRQAEKSALQQQQVISELNTLVKDIDRCEKTLLDLQKELAGANERYPTPRTTRQDVAYLTELLRCANKKLNWEKNIASLQKRIPVALEDLQRLLNDTVNPPSDPVRVQMLRGLQGVQQAMERLQNVKVS